MKYLLAFAGIQTVAIAILAWVVFGGRSDPAPETTSSPARPGQDFGGRVEIAHEAPTLSEDQLRRIIREELAIAMSERPAQTASSKTPPLGPVVATGTREQAERALETYRRRGSITSREMQELQEDIAHLNDDDRSLLAGSLMRALNSGAVKLQNE